MKSIDSAAEARVRESFSRQSHMATLGAEIVFIAPGEVHLAFPFGEEFCQQNGFMHAGAIASVADSANGYAAYTLAPPDTDVLAVEFKINLLARPGVRDFWPAAACCVKDELSPSARPTSSPPGPVSGPSSPPCSPPSSCVPGPAVARVDFACSGARADGWSECVHRGASSFAEDMMLPYRGMTG